VTSPLDRPVWHALSTRQASFAEGNGRARRFARDISLLAATADDTPEAMMDLGALIPSGGAVVLLQTDPSPVPPGAVAEVAAGVQMVADSIVEPTATAQVVDLTDADASDMLALAKLARPGPFESRTHTLGGFVGIREQGRLVAMAGERLRLAGYTEVSGVCTHPDARGQGYATLLSQVVTSRIAGRGDTALLHAFATNHAAISLYERLGFRLRAPIVVTILRRPFSAAPQLGVGVRFGQTRGVV
jgi:predicted GNAT family acetyltransferase